MMMLQTVIEPRMRATYFWEQSNFNPPLDVDNDTKHREGAFPEELLGLH